MTFGAMGSGFGRLGRLGLIGGGGEGWSPARLFPGGVNGAWYDPSDLTTLFQDASATTPVTADGDPVGLIRDKSGNGNHLSAAGSVRFTFHTSDGLFWIEGDGTDDVLFGVQDTVLAQAHDIHVAGIGERSSNAQSDTFFSYTTSASGASAEELAIYRVSGTQRMFRTRYNGLDTFSTGHDFGAMASPAVFMQRRVTTTDTRQYVNGVLVKTFATTTTDFSTPARFRIGRQSNASQFLDGKIYHMVVRDGNMSDADRALLTTYAGAKAGLAL